jgi:DNA-directed RNA polymerase specialized sigma24 family protein
MEIHEIVTKIKAGNTEAWNMLIDRYSKKVYNLALNFAGNRDDASDITQDIFLKVYGNMDKFDEGGNFNAWILKLSKNYCIDYWRKSKNYRQNWNWTRVFTSRVFMMPSILRKIPLLKKMRSSTCGKNCSCCPRICGP